MREYVAIIADEWLGRRSGQRVSIQAVDLKDALRRLEEQFGKGRVFDLHNQEDAEKPRR